MLRKARFLSYALICLAILGGILVVVSPRAQTPPILLDLPPTIAAAEEEFERRVQSAFPLPVSETELVQSLRKQGFRANTVSNIASFSKNSSIFCDVFWRIRWEEENGIVKTLTARHVAICI